MQSQVRRRGSRETHEPYRETFEVKYVGKTGFDPKNNEYWSRYELLFSLEEMRFLEPVGYYIEKWGDEQESEVKYWYNIKPGRYLVLDGVVEKYPNGEGYASVNVYVIEYWLEKRMGKEYVMEMTYWYPSWKIYMTPGWEKECPRIIVDFVNAMPKSLTEPPRLNWLQTYTPEELSILLDTSVISTDVKECGRKSK